MKVKYFVRGLGIGIFLTAIILGISYKSKNSDEDVILRAKKLGMVFSEDVSGSAIELEEKQTTQPDAKEEPSATPKPTEEPLSEPTAEPEPTDRPLPEPTAMPAMETPGPEDGADKPNDETEQISFSVERGDWSRIVAEKLETLGIIDDAKKFDKYLVDNGYAVRIKVGQFKAKKGASFEELAKMISD